MLSFLTRNIRNIWLALVGFTFPALVFAATTPVPTDYLLVKNLPFIGSSTNLTTFLQGLFKLGVGLAVTFAILQIVINGFRYMTSDLIGDKGAARKGMENAVWGLLIIFASVLILNTINPDLTKFNLLTTIDNVVAQINKTLPPTTQPPPGTSQPPAGSWPSDARERSMLTQAGIGINHPNCTQEGVKVPACTSVYGLADDVIEKLINLHTDCKCALTITGGTEYWFHTTGSAHSGGRTVDLSATPSFNTYLGGAGSKCGDTRTKNGITYHWEDSSCSWHPNGIHWHVSF